MKIHEYQAKEILKNYNVPVQDGIAIKDITEFDNAMQNLQQRGINQFVVKSQIHAGGRGKGKIYNPGNRDELILEGGVKFTVSADKAREYTRKMLGNLLVTHQTGPEGKIVRTLFTFRTSLMSNQKITKHFPCIFPCLISRNSKLNASFEDKLIPIARIVNFPDRKSTSMDLGLNDKLIYASLL